MSRGWTIAVLLLVAETASPRGGGAQSIPDTIFDAATTAELRRVIAAARDDALPVAPLVNRVLQGGARRVAAPRVVALIRAHADSMRAARTTLGADASPDELDAGGSALRAGASRSALRRVRAVRPAPTATTALVVLTDLLSRGIAAGEAADAITTVAARAADSSLLALQGAVARDGTPDSPERLRALVERFSRAGPPIRPPPKRPGVGGDTIPGAASRAPFAGPSLDAPPATPLWPAMIQGHALSLSSVSAPDRTSPAAVLADATVAVVLPAELHVAPAAALRFDGSNNRWSAGVTVARSFHPATPVAARVWMNGEIRSPLAPSYRDLPLASSLDLSVTPPGRRHDLAFQLGTDLQRTVGNDIRVGGSVAVGHTRFSRIDSRLVREERPIARDTLTPRPDTLGPTVTYREEAIWRALSRNAVRGALTLHVAGFRLEGGITQRLGAPADARDSLVAQPRTLVTLGVERGVASWATLVAHWASRDPSRVLGTLSPADARLRLGVRVASVRSLVRPALRPSPAVAQTAATAALSIVSATAERDGTQRVRIVVRAPAAERVEVEGDLTGWEPVALVRAPDGAFGGEFALPGEVVRLRVRLDGGAWTPPAGAPTQLDDYGDRVAVYVVATATAEE